MSDPTESIRREMVAEINAEPGAERLSKPSTARCGTLTKFELSSRSSALWPR